MQGKIGGVYKALQDLDIRPTPENVKTLTAIYNTLLSVYEQLGEEASADGGTAAEAQPGAE